MLRALVGLLLLAAAPAMAQQGPVLGYRLDHPLRILAGISDPAFNAAIGPSVDWIAFDNERQLVAALTEGRIDVAIGVEPEGFLDAINAGAPVRLIDIAATQLQPALCAIRHDIAETDASLYGLNVAVDFGSVGEWLFEAQMRALGQDLESPVRHNLAPADAAASLGRSDAAIACATPAYAGRLLAGGADLMTRLEPGHDIGLRWFSGIVAQAGWIDANPREVTALLYGDSGLSVDPLAIAAAADMDLIDTETVLARQIVLTEAEKLKSIWFGGGLQGFLISLAELRRQRGLFDADVKSIPLALYPRFLASPG